MLHQAVKLTWKPFPAEESDLPKPLGLLAKDELKYGDVVPAIFTLSQPRTNNNPYNDNPIRLNTITIWIAPFGRRASLFSKYPPKKVPIHAPGIAIPPAENEN